MDPIVKAMCDVIKHRGPDEDGYFLDEYAALGMRRLKIIDLDTGTQPIYNEDKNIVVVFNGEIYNYQELRRDLFKKGHQFYTASDTEVIAHLYEDFGENFLKYLNGMFALAVWDRRNRKLILARDRMGEKPLYYTLLNNSLIFGSEIKSLLCHPMIFKEIEPEGIYSYFIFNSPPGDLTSYKNIFKLRPAEYLIWQNGSVRKSRFWQPIFRSPLLTSDMEIQERLIDEVENSVRMRMVSDVPIGAFLSGGIDSSIMVALMSRLSSSPVKTFSIGLQDEANSELPFARAVAERYGTEHYELVAQPDALNLVDRIVWHFDEPFGDSSAIPTFLVSQMTREYVTVAISGDGGDELFGGYDRYRRILRRKYTERIPSGIRRAISKLVGDRLPLGFKGKAYFQAMRYDNFECFAVGTKELLKTFLFTEEFLDKIKDVSFLQTISAYKSEGQNLLNQCMYFDMNVYLPDDILTKVDRMSMANSIETRAPYLDHNLVELAMRIPSEKKVSRLTTKIILKDSFRRFLPDIVLSHKKTGFSIPLGEWFRNELKPLALETLSKSKLQAAGILDHIFVDKILMQHMSGYRDHHRLIWLFLMVQLWYENWIAKRHDKIVQALSMRGIPSNNES